MRAFNRVNPISNLVPVGMLGMGHITTSSVTAVCHVFGWHAIPQHVVRRTSSPAFCHSSNLCWASSRFSNQYWHELVVHNVPCNGSIHALTVDFPAQLKPHFTSLNHTHQSRDFDINSGTLSMDNVFGLPHCLIIVAKSSPRRRLPAVARDEFPDSHAQPLQHVTLKCWAFLIKVNWGSIIIHPTKS